MRFTFGIITTPGRDVVLERVLQSVRQQEIPYGNYEVVIVGGTDAYKDGVMNIIPFDESQKNAWITRKKNIITREARFENIIYIHDYITFNPGWYEGFVKYGNNFDVCVTPIQNADGSRFRDWTLWAHDTTPDGSANFSALLPYDVSGLSKFMYISGAYWIAKRELMKEFPLDENLSWGELEDVIWSKQVRQKYDFKLNPHSSVKLLKQKDRVFNDATPELIMQLQERIKCMRL